MFPAVIFINFAFGILITEARVFYVDEPRVNYYPIETDDNVEQASRNLDMTFAAGDPGQNDDRDFIQPMQKVYVTRDRPSIVDITRDIDRPVYYKWPEVPARRIIYSDPFSGERSRKVVKLNNVHKGEVVLELRVIANNDNN